MEAIRKQASKLREQVAKQQQAVLSRLSKDAEIFDDEELKRHQKLQHLYSSTRVTKHFQKDIVRGVEGFISISKKQKQIVKRLAEDCSKYGNEKVNAGFPLATAALQLGTSYNSIEDKRENVLEILNNQVSEPLRGSIRGGPLEDARHMARSCDRLRQEVETQDWRKYMNSFMNQTAMLGSASWTVPQSCRGSFQRPHLPKKKDDHGSKS